MADILVGDIRLIEVEENRKRWTECSSVGNFSGGSNDSEFSRSVGERAWALRLAGDLVEACPGPANEVDWEGVQRVVRELIDACPGKIDLHDLGAVPHWTLMYELARRIEK